MNTVTIPRELVRDILLLMTRDAIDADVPPGQWLTFANALDKAMHAPGALQNAPGATPATPVPLTPCRFCRVAVTTDGGLCATCATELLADAQELERSKHECPRCHDA